MIYYDVLNFAYHIDVVDDSLWPNIIVLQTLFTKIYEFDNQIFNKLNNIPYLNHEWKMKIKYKNT
jgi:hypothetical protein